jgi:uncharacterized protein with HEPN domain
MNDRAIFRIRDVVDAIIQIEILADNLAFHDFANDRVKRAAFERFIEIISEASRHLPVALRDNNPEIEWRNIAGIGNHLRHAYHRADAEILWNLHDHGHLRKLKAACLEYLKAS